MVTARSLEDAVRLESVDSPLTEALVIGAVAALAAGWLAPAPPFLPVPSVAILAEL